MFFRVQYYSQTEIVKTFQVSVKVLKARLINHQVLVVEKDVDQGEFRAKASYVLKEDIEKLKLQCRS